MDDVDERAWQRRTGVKPGGCGWRHANTVLGSSSFWSVQVHDAAYVAGVVDIKRDDPSWSVRTTSSSWTASAIDELNRVNSVTVVLRRKKDASGSTAAREVVTFLLVCNEAETGEAARLFPQAAASLAAASVDAFDAALCSCATIFEGSELAIRCSVVLENLKVDRDLTIPVIVRVSFSEIGSGPKALVAALAG